MSEIGHHFKPFRCGSVCYFSIHSEFCQYTQGDFKIIFVEASSIGDTFPLKKAVKGRCGDFRSKAKKILPDLDCGSLSV